MNLHTILSQQLTDIGLEPDDIVTVHASMRAAKIDVYQLIDALLQSNRTLMMYLGCETPYDDVGRGKYTQEEERHILETCPAFDYQNNSAEPDHGILAEKFRTHTGTICSHHVGWRMAANGERAHELMDNHPLQFGAAENSPFERLVKANGKILLIGSDLDSVSLLHYAETLTSIPNKKLVHIKVPLLTNGQRQWIDVTEHDSSTGICDWPDRYFETIVKDFIQDNNIHSAKVGQADSYLFDARALVAFAVPHMEQQAHALKLI